ncbi:uncharacterized protein EV154DRAFT_478120 [Mucor mucedo]|uniref:uncharacterized protein n=1 Tax=Mucor mucedo TaxID=29922 RepID=UPI00221F1BC0|nr:uncharacterized protein EV154DRAFT_478120 [Mucor mucedo]KAI7894727.1 hypothetical protein EV154DRAFT_478120 [Mucor mucedo]
MIDDQKNGQRVWVIDVHTISITLSFMNLDLQDVLLKGVSLRLTAYSAPALQAVSNLKLIAFQCQGVKLQIFGTKHVSQKHSASYNKGVFAVPKIVNNLTSFAQTLADTLSLKRLVYLNYRKIGIILEAKRQHDIELMHLKGCDT